MRKVLYLLHQHGKVHFIDYFHISVIAKSKKLQCMQMHDMMVGEAGSAGARDSQTTRLTGSSVRA